MNRRQPYRTAASGQLRAEHVGQPVTLAGWVAARRDHGGVAFLDLRDASGLVQVVLRDIDLGHSLRSEYCVQISGQVTAREQHNRNPQLPTGDIEVAATELTVLSTSAALPFQFDEERDVSDEVRLKYRYLDLRRPGPAAALRMRSHVNQIARDVLLGLDFIEVETPTLTRSTPEGARDFLVPVRLQPGAWYALPQSPQLFKQLLMVAGLERYFQIARCYRDEDFRADRQPEFTQLDVEMSFVEQEDVLAVGEQIVRALWGGVLDHKVGEIPRISYAESMARYGNDKPDLRFGLELTDLTDYFVQTEFRVFQAPYVGAVVMPGGASQPRRTFDAWQEFAKQRGARGLAYVTFEQDGTLGGPVAKNLSESEREGLMVAVGASAGDCAFFAAGPAATSQGLLAAVRLEVGARCGLIDSAQWSFVWVLDAPMFERTDQGGWSAVHHPFTSPHSDWAETFADHPDQALAYAYDLVCNGHEIGGGSVRIHRSDMQRRVFEVIGLSEQDAADKFGFLLEAFGYGPPPHAGIAFGWDRIVMLLAGASSLREVIAFPKTGGGGDPLTGAPTPITAAQRAEAGVDAVPEH